jgi:hypothetical protein
MLKLIVNITESFDERTSTFIVEETYVLRLEHSLVSLSKWESNFEKPFLSTTDKTTDEIKWYIEAMCLDEIPQRVFEKLTPDDYLKIKNYISAKMTATWISEVDSKKQSREIITAEIIYYWMIALGIPQEYQYWHLNRLLMLIRVCNLKNAPAKKMSAQETANRNRELNEQRKAQLKSRG